MADPAPRDRAELDAIETFEDAAVTEALEFYMWTEEIYVAADASLSKPRTTCTSNSTNWG